MNGGFEGVVEGDQPQEGHALFGVAVDDTLAEFLVEFLAGCTPIGPADGNPEEPIALITELAVLLLDQGVEIGDRHAVALEFAVDAHLQHLGEGAFADH